MLKLVQVHSMKWNRPSILHRSIHNGGGLYRSPTKSSREADENIFLYFALDEQIKRDDWVITKTGYVRKCTATRPIGDKYICLSEFNLVLTSHCKKIVATTDSVLKDKAGYNDYAPVADIPIDFIEAYVEAQGKITEVLLEYSETIVTGRYSGIREELQLDINDQIIWKLKKEEKLYTRAQLKAAIIRASFQGFTQNEEFDQWFNKNYPQ